MNTKIIKLDINRRLYDKIVAKQDDTGSRFLLFQLLDGAVPFNLTDRSVRVYGVKPDGAVIFNDLTVTHSATGFCLLELTNQMLAITGTVKLELMITEGDKKLTSIPFEMEVIKKINSNDAVESSNEFRALLNALKEIDDWNKEFADKSGKLEELYTPRLNELGSQLETNVQYLKDIEVSPLLFGAKGDGVTDDTIPFSMCMDYCIENKKTMQITPGYVFAISSIEKTIKSDNGFTMRGNGQQSVIKVINTENKEGIKLNVAGNFRVINVGSFKIIGNPKSGSGLVVVRAVRPSQVYNIIGTEFTNVNVAPVKLIDCIDIQPKNIYSRKVSNGILLEGQCDGCDIHKITVYDWSEYAINVTPAIETTTSLLENSICLSIYEPYFYGTGELTDNHEGKVAINLVDCEKFSLYGGWFEQCEYALKGMVGDKNTGCPNSSIINPKRGGSIKPKIYLEKSSNSFIQSQSLDVELASNCENCFVIATSIISVTENGKNTILARDGFNLSNLCIMDSRGGYKPIITEGLSYSTLSIQSEGEKVLTLNNTVGTIEIIATTTRGLIAKYQYRIGSNPFNFPITSNENVVTGIDLSEFTDSKINISFNSDKTIKIVNKTSSTKTLKIILN